MHSYLPAPSFHQRLHGCKDIVDLGGLLATIATCFNCGQIKEILSATELGIEWISYSKVTCLIPWSFWRIAFQNWNEVSGVQLFFLMNTVNGNHIRSCVFACPEIVRKIKIEMLLRSSK